MTVQTCDVVVFPIVPKNVADVFTLSEHPAAPCKVVYPWPGHICPGVVSVEPLSIDTEAQTRLEIIQRLMGTVMYHKMVKAVCNLCVCCPFDVSGMESVGFTSCACGCK